MDYITLAEKFGPLVFFAGGGYALFKWRLKKVEDALEKMAEQCVENRTNCNAGIAAQIGAMRIELKADFNESKADRVALRTALHKIDKDVARLDQKVTDRNGYGHKDS